MLKEGPEEGWPLVFGQQRAGNLVGEVLDILRDEVGHFSILGMAPTMLDGIQFWCIRRELFDMEAGAIEVTQQARGFLVPTEAIPDHQQRTLEMAAELLDKRKDIVPGDVGRRDRKIESQALTPGRDGDGAGDGQAVVTIPTIMDRCLALRCPRPAHRGLQHEAALINQNDRAALTPGFF